MCTQRKNAWYDTLLGGLGSGIGITNSVDLEVLFSHLQNAEKDIAPSVNLNAQWLPTSIIPHQNTLPYQNVMNI